jgi:DNA invertase Pin-like site-specific DNA recombinase
MKGIPDDPGNKGFVGSPVVGYIRSAKLGDSQLDVWEAEIRAYCAERGYNLVEVIRDDGVSGVAAWKPGLERLIRDVEDGRLVGVLIPGYAHLESTQNAQKRIIKRMEQAGAWVQCISPPIFTDVEPCGHRH